MYAETIATPLLAGWIRNGLTNSMEDAEGLGLFLRLCTLVGVHSPGGRELCRAGFAGWIVHTAYLSDHGVWDGHREGGGWLLSEFLNIGQTLAYLGAHAGFCGNRDVTGAEFLLVLLPQSKFDWVSGSLGAQVVHAGFEAFLPCVEVHGRQLCEGRRFHEQVKALTLADECTAVGRHIDDCFLANLVGGFIDFADGCGDILHSLDRSVGGHDGFPHFFVPELQAHQVTHQVFVYHDVFSGECTAGVKVRGIGLEALIVAQDLAGAGGGHGGQE